MQPTALGVIVVILVGVIAVSTTLLAIVAISAAIHVRDVEARLDEALKTVQEHAPPLLRAARGASEDLQKIAGRLRDEGHAVTDLSSDLRKRILRAADGLEARLDDLDSLFTVVYDEVEDTVLDVTAGLRTLRRGRSVVGRMRRALFSRR